MSCNQSTHALCDHPLPTQSPSLYSQIDVSSVIILNSTSPPHFLIKPYTERQTPTYITSDSDQELLIHIPFTSSITLKSIELYSTSDSSPREMYLYANRPGLDFESISGSIENERIKCIHGIREGISDVVEYYVKYVCVCITLLSYYRLTTL